MDLSIFTLLRPFGGEFGGIQRNGIRSWLELVPRPEVVLLDEVEGAAEVADELGVGLWPVERNEYGTALLNDAFARAAEVCSGDGLAFVSADIILMSDFARAVEACAGEFEEFAAVARRRDVRLDGEITFRPGWEVGVVRAAFEYGKWHTPLGIDVLVWRGDFWGEVPPFAVGRCAHDNWCVARALEVGVPVVDLTPAVTAIHQEHVGGHVRSGPEYERNRALMGGLHAGVGDATWRMSADRTRITRQ